MSMTRSLIASAVLLGVYTAGATAAVSDHVLQIQLSRTRDYRYTQGTDHSYKFDAAVRGDDSVSSVVMKTPSGNDYSLSLEVEDGERWFSHGVRADNEADLAEFTVGTYTFTISYATGGSDVTTVLYALPNGDAIPPVTQRPVLLYPADGAAGVPVLLTFEYEPLEDPAWTAGFEWEAVGGSSDEGYVEGLPESVSAYGPVALEPHTTYEVDMAVGQAVWGSNPDGISTVVDADAEERFTFTTGGAVILSDTFNDNSTNTFLWNLHQSNSAVVWLEEVNQRLELRSTGVHNDADVDYFANAWGLSPAEDFSIRIDFQHGFIPPTTPGDTDWDFSVHLGLAKDDENGVFLEAGYGVDRSGGAHSFFYCATDVDGSESSQGEKDKTVSDGTLYVSYNADTDELYLSDTGYWAVNAWVTIPGLLQGHWGGSPVFPYVGGWSDGVALDSGNAYLDNFVVDSGQRAVDDGLQPDPFAGSRTVELYGDDNIKDGIQLDSFHVNLAVSTSDSLHYAADITGDRGGLSLAMTRDGNLLTLDPRPQTTTINSYMLSDGVNGAFLLMGQEPYDPLDISIRMATWAGNTPISTSQIAGGWQMRWIGDDNLRDNPQDPFPLETRTFTILDLENGEVEVRYGDPSTAWIMRIEGNTLVPTAGTLDPAHVYLSIMTDGQSLVIAGIGVELSDPTDVSAWIGFATRDEWTIPHDWNGDGIVSIVGDVPPFVNCVYFGTCAAGLDTLAVGDCSGDGILSIIGDVPCFVDCVYFASCP